MVEGLEWGTLVVGWEGRRDKSLEGALNKLQMEEVLKFSCIEDQDEEQHHDVHIQERIDHKKMMMMKLKLKLMLKKMKKKLKLMKMMKKHSQSNL